MNAKGKLELIIMWEVQNIKGNNQKHLSLINKIKKYSLIIV